MKMPNGEITICEIDNSGYTLYTFTCVGEYVAHNNNVEWVEISAYYGEQVQPGIQSETLVLPPLPNGAEVGNSEVATPGSGNRPVDKILGLNSIGKLFHGGGGAVGNSGVATPGSGNRPVDKILGLNSIGKLFHGGGGAVKNFWASIPKLKNPEDVDGDGTLDRNDNAQALTSQTTTDTSENNETKKTDPVQNSPFLTGGDGGCSITTASTASPLSFLLLCAALLPLTRARKK